MKTIEVDEELYRYIASHTQHIGESASDILRRILKFTAGQPEREASTAADDKVAMSVETSSEQLRPDHVRAVRELLLSDEYAEQKKVVDRFIMVLSTLYSLDTVAFALATEELYGRTRIYFAGDQQTLLESGTHTKPKHVQGTPYWVITNTNTARKRGMIAHIMQVMQFPPKLIEKVCGTV